MRRASLFVLLVCLYMLDAAGLHSVSSHTGLCCICGPEAGSSRVLEKMGFSLSRIVGLCHDGWRVKGVCVCLNEPSSCNPSLCVQACTSVADGLASVCCSSKWEGV